MHSVLMTWILLWLCLWFTPPTKAFLTRPAPGSSCWRHTATAQLYATRRVAVYDGAEWASIQAFLSSSPEQSPPVRKPQQDEEVGYMTVVAGTTNKDSQKRVVGIQAPSDVNAEVVLLSDDGIQVYKDSAVTVPKGVSFDDAISTLVAALAGVHCSLPRIQRVGGGSDDASFVWGKVVVMGGSDYACFVAEGLGALGANVSVVTTRKVRVNGERVNVMPPAVGELQLGFAAVLGDFDALVDTMSDEERRGGPGGSGVCEELKRQHNCHRYVSTLPTSQRIVRDSGVLFGPKKAENRVSDIVKALSSANKKLPSNFQSIVPPKDFFSTTVQTLLDTGVLFRAPGKGKDVLVRGWSLQDFWELASWPRDSAGGANVRFGLPVIDDIETKSVGDDEVMVSAPPMSNLESKEEVTIEEEEEEENAKSKNPFVAEISDVQGLQTEIVSSHRDCVLFLSAPYCRTCRYLTPSYTRMARMVTTSDDNNKANLLFAKANTAGKRGKELGRVLQVEAVPSFVMFRGGRRYGIPLAISRLPSKKLDLAVEYLTSGMEWDITAFRDMD